MSSGMPGSFEGDHDALIAQFMGAHNVSTSEATQWLSASNWNLTGALNAYQAHLDEDDDGDEEEEDEDTAGPQGGRTLAGGSSSRSAQASQGAGPSSGPKPSSTGKKIVTLGELGSSQQPEPQDDSSDDDQDLFAGGEKSGLAVQNPDDLKKKIIEKARRNEPRPGGDVERSAPSNFRGTARTLGGRSLEGEDIPSQVIEDPNANVDQPEPLVERRLHFWTNGFSVDDGELYDTNDPRNAEILRMIRSGRAPLGIMNVTPDQEVDIKIEEHDGPYVAPKKKANPFSGAGQRLGSPTPGALASSSSAAPPTSTQSTGSAAAPDVDQSQPTVSIQIRLGDGTRLVSRFNPTHRISDIYNFVAASNPESARRPYMLMTTFPSKDLDDQTKTIGDTGELKKGGAVVQKWL